MHQWSTEVPKLMADASDVALNIMMTLNQTCICIAILRKSIGKLFLKWSIKITIHLLIR